MRPPSLRRLLPQFPWLYVSFVFLFAVTVYCVWYANYYLAGNSDDLVYPYLFHHFLLHDLVLPSQHSNYLKFPLFALQSYIPQNFVTFTLVNMGLAGVTILGWAALLCWTFGKRFAPLTCGVFAALLLGSTLLNLDLVGTTIRNIEYPLAFAVLLYVGYLVAKGAPRRINRLSGGVLALLYVLTVAGDSFFLYILSFTALLLIAVAWGRAPTPKLKRLAVQAAGFVIGMDIAGLLLRVVARRIGIAHYFTDGAFLPHILPASHIAPSLSVSLTQLLNLCGADIFGLSLRPGNALVFMNFGLVVLGVIGLASLARSVFRSEQSTQLAHQFGPVKAFALSGLGLAFFVTFTVYIVSDLAVLQAANGTIASAGQERYLTLLPLLIVVGVVYFVWHRVSSIRSLALATLIIALGLAFSLPAIHRNHTYDSSLRQGPMAVAQAAERNHITELITGYWYGASSRFWAHDNLNYASVANCNVPSPPINTRLSWYKASPSLHKSALVVVHSGVDAVYWQCTDDQLRNIYGAPAQIIYLNTPDKPTLWVYSYDVRSKLLPLSY